jgi:GNAT superfamily N-acetyltransferase
MTIRPAELEDLEACLSLDHSYFTEYVWQMDVQEEKDGVMVHFRTVRLPRTVHVQYPRDRKAQLTSWHRRDCFLVAVADEKGPQAESATVVGYLTLGESEWHKTAWVADLVIAPENRRKGLATQLLRAAALWARKAGLYRLIVETQTKNYPAIRFLERNGFSFCGYNDRYYANQDIGLFFSVDLS